MNKISIAALVLLIVFSDISGQTAGKESVPKKNYKATHIAIAPVIDGILGEAVWNEGIWMDDFIQNEPYNGTSASQRTEFCVLFDDDNIYVAIRAYDLNPDSIISRLTRRDQEDGDKAGIVFDSFHDLRTGFLFGTTSSGVKFDKVFSDDGDNEDESWDPNWWVKTSVNDAGWVAEMKIPFSQVRFEKSSGDVWGVQVFREIFRKDETDFWQHIPKDAPGLIHHFGEMSGMENIEPRKIFDITPYTVGAIETFEAEPENPFMSKGTLSRLSGGIDSKIGVTNNMTLDLTINPDFGQVEADPSEVNLSAYESFFSEKRPFFIEGSNITSFIMGIGDGGAGNDNLFYSRRIGRRPQGNPDLEDGWYSKTPTNTTILGAAKLTGKTKDGLSLGFVEAMTAKEIAEIDTGGGSKYQTVEPLTNYFVGRVQKDFKEGNTIFGGMITGTHRDLEENLGDFMHKAAYTGGLDFTQYFRNKSWSFNVNYGFSHVLGSREAITRTQKSSARYLQRPDKTYAVLDTNKTSLTGTGGRMQISKLDGHWRILGAAKWKSPGFEANDLGFVREADQVLSFIWVGYNEWDPKGIYRNFNVGNDIFGVWDYSGELLTWGYEWNGNISFKNFWNAWTGGNLQFNGKSPAILRGGPMMRNSGHFNLRLGFSSDDRKKLSFSVFANHDIGFQRSSESSYAEVELSYKPVDFLSLSFVPGYSKSYSELQYVTNDIKINDEARYIFASIDRETVSTSLRVNLNLSPNLTFQYWGQPFISTGSYQEYKYITTPMAERYNDRFHVFSPQQAILNNDKYSIDENIDGIPDYTFNKPDFNIQEFLSNFVIRWEYNPGSSVYLVWSQTRGSRNDTGNLRLFDDLGELFSTDDRKPHNVFLIKFSYRFGLN